MTTDFWLDMGVGLLNALKAIVLGIVIGGLFALLGPWLVNVVFPGTVIVDVDSRLYTSSYPALHGVFVIVGFCVGALASLAASITNAVNSKRES